MFLLIRNYIGCTNRKMSSFTVTWSFVRCPHSPCSFNATVASLCPDPSAKGTHVHRGLAPTGRKQESTLWCSGSATSTYCAVHSRFETRHRWQHWPRCASDDVVPGHCALSRASSLNRAIYLSPNSDIILSLIYRNTQFYYIFIAPSRDISMALFGDTGWTATAKRAHAGICGGAV